MISLDGLNPTNTFERKLLDVLVAMASSGTPIPVQVSGGGYDDRAIHQRLDQVIAHVQQLEADYQNVAEKLATHHHPVEGVDDIRSQIIELHRMVHGLRAA